MKKSLVAALTGALVVGATATTFAAANPFSDVPAGHWAYNSVTKLASEGVIEGYGDGTYRGNRNITRYEMAQMIARALARAPQSNMSYASRTELDKLAAEFRDELDSLGVRVSELEKHADFVKWAGKIEYTYGHLRNKNNITDEKDTSISNGGVFRLEPVAEVNDHWNAVARFDAGFDIRNDSTNDVKLKRVYAEGNYDKFNVKLGRFGFCPAVEDGMVVDTVVSGGQLTFGDKWKFTITAGRVGADSDEAHYYGGASTNATTTYLNQIAADELHNSAYGALASNILTASGLDSTVADQYAANNGFAGVASSLVSTPYTNGYYVSAYDIYGFPVYGARSTLTGADQATLGKYGKAYDTLYNAGFNNAYVASVLAGNDYNTAVAQGIIGANAHVATFNDSINSYAADTHPTDILGLNISYDSGDKGLYGLASYYWAKDKDFQNYFYSNSGDDDKANVWAINLGYRFADNLRLWGGYAQNTKADNEKSAWQAEIRYGTYGDYAEKGDWAIWAGYAKFGYNVGIATNQTDDVQTGTKGWHIGAAYAPFKNVGLLFRYSDGKYITSNDKYRKVFARAEWFF